MTEQMLHKYKPGDRVQFPGDGRVFVVGRSDGACINVRQEDDASNAGPVYGWAPATSAGLEA